MHSGRAASSIRPLSVRKPTAVAFKRMGYGPTSGNGPQSLSHMEVRANLAKGGMRSRCAAQGYGRKPPLSQASTLASRGRSKQLLKLALMRGARAQLSRRSQVDLGQSSLRREMMESVCRWATAMEAVETHLVSASGWRVIMRK
eukprot:5662244-Prymnesium_polylepis.1